MFGLGNLFGGLGNLFTLPNMLQALELLSGGLNVYGQVNSMLNPPKMPDFPRLDQQGNRGQPAPSPTLSPESQARRFASARSHLAERGVYSGGAAENPLAAMQSMFNDSPETLYAMLGQGQALPYEEDLYGGSA